MCIRDRLKPVTAVELTEVLKNMYQILETARQEEMKLRMLDVYKRQVQFHPEACPGPKDSGYLFDRFMKMMGGEE